MSVKKEMVRGHNPRSVCSCVLSEYNVVLLYCFCYCMNDINKFHFIRVINNLRDCHDFLFSGSFNM